MSKTYVPLLPAVIGDGATTQFSVNPASPGTHYTSVDEGMASANIADKCLTTLSGKIEELLLGSGLSTGTPGNITEFRFQFRHKGQTGTGSPIITFEIFVKQTSGGSFVQVGESKTVGTDTGGVVSTGQITWLDSDSTPFVYSAADWASAYQRKIRMTSGVDPGGTPTPDNPSFQYVG